MSSLFITGFSGFLGRHLLRKLDSARYNRIFGLSRNGLPPECSPHIGNFELVRGGLTDVDAYAPALACADTVIHLAAVTGKRSPHEYFSVNTEDTRLFLRQCMDAGV